VNEIPVPEPRAGESERDFIGRCISTLHKTDPDRSQDQIIAICYSSWRGEGLHADFNEILRKYVRQWGDDGPDKFFEWIEKMGLDPSKPYTVPTQLMKECLNGVCEAFRWTAPYIQFYKEDTDAKYYKCTALTANVSMNKNDYEDAIELAANAASLGYKPLNLNHDHSKWLPFPEARTDLTRFEDNAVESIIRIPNKGHVPNTSYSMRDIQRMIENGDIYHPSIEGDPRAGAVTEKGKAPQGYIFTALALLEKDKTLPGDPLTRLEPLFLRESMGRSLVESLSKGEKIKVEVKPKMLTEKEQTTTDSGNAPHLEPPLAQEKAELEEGVGGISQCGQCRYFKELLDTETKTPNITGHPSDSYVIRREGGIGAGVGNCQLTGEHVRKNDAACSDGRVREEATSLERTVEELEMKRKIADLEEKLLFEQQNANRIREEKSRVMQENIDLTDQLTRIGRERGDLDSSNAQLKKDRDDLREEIDKLREGIAKTQIDITRLERDVKFYKDQYDAYERTVKRQEVKLQEMQVELSDVYAKLNDAMEKQARATQRSQNSESDKARAITENAINLQKLAEKTREVSDLSGRLNDYAKQQVTDGGVIAELRKERDKLVEEIRELKQKLGKAPRRIVVKT